MIFFLLKIIPLVSGIVPSAFPKALPITRRLPQEVRGKASLGQRLSLANSEKRKFTRSSEVTTLMYSSLTSFSSQDFGPKW